MVRWVRCGRWIALGFVALVAVANVAILAASRVMALTTDAVRPAVEVDGVTHLRVVDERVWRGARPSEAGYRTLDGRPMYRRQAELQFSTWHDGAALPPADELDEV